MQYFSSNQERARPIAETKSYHLYEGEDDCEDMELRNEDFNECNQDKGNDYDPLSLHHECSSSIFL